MNSCLASSGQRTLLASGACRQHGVGLPRPSVLARASYSSDRPIFQLHCKQQLTLEDVRDAYEVCSLIPAPEERAQCYSVFGLDGTRMLEYYETVLKLEEELQTNSAQRSGFWDEDDHWSKGASTSSH